MGFVQPRSGEEVPPGVSKRGMMGRREYDKPPPMRQIGRQSPDRSNDALEAPGWRALPEEGPSSAHSGLPSTLKLNNDPPLKYPSLFLLAILAGLASHAPAQAADVIINEIMYRPSSQNVGEEYVELLNRGTNTVNLHGWRLTKGVDFTFTNLTLAPGSYLVVAADRAQFQAKYPGVANVVGNWMGVLKNAGEEIELENAAGGTESSVAYANEGDWGTRRRSFSLSGTRGWEWFADHDGFGKSLELVNPDLPNDVGQNWASSLAFEGTPGIANSVLTPDGAPLILDARHSPPVPTSTTPVTITARIRDELTTGLGVALFYRDHSFDYRFSSPPPFASADMFDDGAHGDGLAGDEIGRAHV